MKDKTEIAKEIHQLHAKDYFGEGALHQPGPRPNSVIVFSETAKILRLTKAAFDEITAVNLRIQEETSRSICHNVINSLPIFEVLPVSQKQLVFDWLIKVHFVKDSFLCRQGLSGDSLFIISQGHRNFFYFFVGNC